MSDLVTDSKREGLHAETTGIPVRAKNQEGRFKPVDIAELDRDSLHRWLRSRGGKNLWAENTVLQLLGHAPITKEADDE